MGKSNEKVGVVNCGLSSRSLENSFVDVIAVILNDSCEERAPLIVLRLSLRMSLSLARSTRRQCERKKSPPMMGCVTSAIIKLLLLLLKIFISVPYNNYRTDDTKSSQI